MRRRGEMTVAAIARLAGVSVPTVSKVLNGRSGVAEETRRRVERVLLENGYRRPEAVPSAPVIEVLFQALESHLAIELMRGVERVAGTRMLAVGFTELRGPQWLQEVLSRRPVGVIAVYAGDMRREREKLAAAGIPLVALDPTGELREDVPSVGAANWNGGVAATRHLLDLGHRRIAAIGGPAHFLAARARADGFRAALEMAGLTTDPDLVSAAPFSFDTGLTRGTELLTRANPPTAVFCGNDLIALGVYEAARRLGRRIPDDLSLVGFDDLEFAQWIGPPLTTVRQPLSDMGAVAAELVLTLANGETPERHRVELSTTLIVRGSAATLP